jgi:hypothetical protein
VSAAEHDRSTHLSVRQQTRQAHVSLTDDLGDDVIARLTPRYDVVTSASIRGSASRPTALYEAPTCTDLVIAVMPAPQDKSRINVIFELGVTVGLLRVRRSGDSSLCRPP